MLSISKVDVYRGETQVLWDISMEVQRGERVAVLGGNGAGKSSLLGAITGSIPIRKGEAKFCERSLIGESTHKINQLGIAIVPEGRRVYKEMTVRENLEIGAYPKRSRDRLEQTAQRVIELFPILEKRKNQRAATLSGGEQQMLAIGRAMMSLPELLLIDELSLGLAPVVTRQIYQTLDNLGKDITILLVEQNVEQALKHSQRAYIMESGHITRSGDSSDLIKDEDIRRAYLGM
ncbi:MAG: ABC transporter ATP-binding protein [Deltaproteobacteria bacterium]|nr:ABC transporter ATP-binding protein [Deltaproteobacteria bacterium]